jgi:predicted nucleotidyltransferase
MKRTFVQKKYLKLYEETARNKVLEVLFKFSEKEFSLSELAKEAGVAKANIGKILEDLYNKQFIEIVKLTKIWRIKANRSNWYFIRSKIIYNLNFIYQSGLVEFLNEHFKNPKAIVLFGSFRRGEDISNSDIDIAIESEDVKEYETIKLNSLEEFEKIIGRSIQIHVFNRKNADLNVFNNIVNGIVLLGFLEVKL